ncbi:MAG: PQQ-dependent sugar dehydrogenase [Phycisphaerae bacterium]
MAAPNDGTGRLFILDQVGQIWIIDSDGTKLSEPFLDVSDRMPEIGIDFGDGVVFDERGLLGLAFHPNFNRNGLFYVFYSIPLAAGDPENFNCRNRVAEMRVSADDANRADLDSERVLLEILKPQFNHNGGQLAFGPDGMLYIGVGDGGNANDDGDGHTAGIGNGQDKSTLLGKILRIDVDGDPYDIPADNPFVDDSDARPEIYALGLRNPWRFSFDSQGRLFVADVGQDLFEEVDIVTAGGNYGWRIREGDNCFDVNNPGTPPASCATTAADGAELISPILSYPHSADQQPFGISVTGGFVYRGRDIPCLIGEYVFGDWSTNFAAPDGTLFAASENAGGDWTLRELKVSGASDGRLGRFILSFGQDADGELYVLTSENFGPIETTGVVFRVAPAE